MAQRQVGAYQQPGSNHDSDVPARITHAEEGNDLQAALLGRNNLGVIAMDRRGYEDARAHLSAHNEIPEILSLRFLVQLLPLVQGKAIRAQQTRKADREHTCRHGTKSSKLQVSWR